MRTSAEDGLTISYDLRCITGLFDSHALLADMYARPQLYLNGSAPFNVTGAAHACVYQLNESQHDPGVCTDAPDPDSYLWQVV